eukprot:7208510-Prymnesium_polylepis.1
MHPNVRTADICVLKLGGEGGGMRRELAGRELAESRRKRTTHAYIRALELGDESGGVVCKHLGRK